MLQALSIHCSVLENTNPMCLSGKSLRSKSAKLNKNTDKNIDTYPPWTIIASESGGRLEYTFPFGMANFQGQTCC